jgi:hypothetical protein
MVFHVLPSSLIDSNVSMRWKQQQNKELRHAPWFATLGGRRACWSSEMGTRKSDKHQLLTWTCTKQTTSWLVCSLSAFGPWMNHGQTLTHKTHHGLGGSHHLPPYNILCAWPWDQHPNGILSGGFPSENPEIPKVATLAILGAHNIVWRPSIEIRFEEML